MEPGEGKTVDYLTHKLCTCVSLLLLPCAIALEESWATFFFNYFSTFYCAFDDDDLFAVLEKENKNLWGAAAGGWTNSQKKFEESNHRYEPRPSAQQFVPGVQFPPLSARMDFVATIFFFVFYECDFFLLFGRKKRGRIYFFPLILTCSSLVAAAAAAQEEQVKFKEWECVLHTVSGPWAGRQAGRQRNIQPKSRVIWGSLLSFFLSFRKTFFFFSARALQSKRRVFGFFSPTGKKGGALKLEGKKKERGPPSFQLPPPPPPPPTFSVC